MLHVADQITQLGIKRAELMSIFKRQQGGVTRWEVKRISGAADPAPLEPPTIPALDSDAARQYDRLRAELE